MPPKAITIDLGLTASNIAVIRASLIHVDSFKPDMAAVSHEIGIKNKNNAPRDLKAALKKLNLIYKDGKVFSATEGDATAGPAASGTTKANASPEKGSGGKKRKASEETEGDESVKKPKHEESENGEDTKEFDDAGATSA